MGAAMRALHQLTMLTGCFEVWSVTRLFFYVKRSLDLTYPLPTAHPWLVIFCVCYKGNDTLY